MNKFFITARSSSGQWLYYRSNDSQGQRMIPNAVSIATPFETKHGAELQIEQLQKLYKGLTDWRAEKQHPY